MDVKFFERFISFKTEFKLIFGFSHTKHLHVLKCLLCIIIILKQKGNVQTNRLADI